MWRLNRQVLCAQHAPSAQTLRNNLRLLHTSDWHLGLTTGAAQFSRHAEHERFLAWLRSTIVEREIQVLLIAGDVFQHPNPSAEAQRLYYRFLAGLSEVESLERVVVIGGNHDSPTRLDAPADILESLAVEVVGGHVEGLAAHAARVIEFADGQRLGVAALPFVNDFKLGVRYADRTPAEIASEIRERFTELYTAVADHLSRRLGDARLIALGHLTCVGARQTDYNTAIHHTDVGSRLDDRSDERMTIGTVGALPPSIFDERYSYVALGHIHRQFPVVEGDKKRVWYSGTPVPTSPHEGASKRYVLEVELTEPDAKVTPIVVPSFREFRAIRGQLHTVLERIGDWNTECELRPYVSVEVETDSYEPDLLRKLRQAAQRVPESRRPQIVEHRQTLADRLDEARDSQRQSYDLRALSDEEVFRQLHLKRWGSEDVDERLMSRFREVSAEVAK